jgi:transcriptional regulator with XRE-family HTH domain
MKFHEALNQTLRDYGISAKWLSEQSGVSMAMISQFKNGKQRIYSDSLESIIEALPAEMQRHLFGLVSGSNFGLKEAIDSADEQQLEEAFRLIGQRMFSKSTDALRSRERVKSYTLS